MIDYNATLQDFFAECQKFLKKRASRAKDETELQDIRYAISTVMRVKQNPEKYSDYVVRITDGLGSSAVADGFAVDNNFSVYLTYTEVLGLLPDFYGDINWRRQEAQEKLLKALKKMKYVNSSNILKGIYYPFVSPTKFAAKLQNQR